MVVGLHQLRMVVLIQQQLASVVTSAGRTVYEAASLGVPTVVLCQNDRELQHDFASPDHGIINLGIDPTDDAIRGALGLLVTDYPTRWRMSSMMKKADLTRGTDRVLGAIWKACA